MGIQCTGMRLRLRRGLTFTEVLTVVAILAIVSAIAYPVYTRARAKSYETSCTERLKQNFQALQMYAADYPGYRPIHRNVDLPTEPMSDPTLLEAYMPEELLHCPEAPACAREWLTSTYAHTMAAPLDGPYRSIIERQLDQRFPDDLHTGYPIIYCLVHDELHYFPAERELAEKLNPPFVIRLKPDGSVSASRFPVVRGHDVARTCAQRKKSL